MIRDGFAGFSAGAGAWSLKIAQEQLDFGLLLPILIAALGGGGVVGLLLLRANRRELDTRADKTLTEAKLNTAQEIRLLADEYRLEIGRLRERVDELEERLRHEVASRDEVIRERDELRRKLTRLEERLVELNEVLRRRPDRIAPDDPPPGGRRATDPKEKP